MEFDLASPTGKHLARRRRPRSRVDGRFLYGAPAVRPRSRRRDEDRRRPRSAPGFAGYQFGLADDEVDGQPRKPLEDLPQTDDDGKAKFTVTLDKLPATTRPLEAQVTVRMAESGGRAVERNLTLPVDADRRP